MHKILVRTETQLQEKRQLDALFQILYVKKSIQTNFEGIIFNYRKVNSPNDIDHLVKIIADFKRPLLEWMVGKCPRPEETIPIVILFDENNFMFEYFSTRIIRIYGPSFLFSLGISAIKISADFSHDDAMKSGKCQIDNLKSHPLILLKDRASQLFGEGKKVTSYNPETLVPIIAKTNNMTECHEIMLIKPSTYQMQGGGSMLISPELLRSVLEHIMISLLGENGKPKDGCGYTAIPGKGAYYSPSFNQMIYEEIEQILIFGPIGSDAACSLSGYLRWAWLQDSIFITYDGRPVDEYQSIEA